MWPGSERVTSLKYLLRPPCPKEGSACAWTDVPSRSLHRAKLRLPEGFSLCSVALSPGLGTCRPPSTPSSPGTPTLASGPPCLRVLGSSPPSPGDLTHGRYRLRAPSVCRSCGAAWGLPTKESFRNPQCHTLETPRPRRRTPGKVGVGGLLRAWLPSSPTCSGSAQIDTS